MSAELYHDTFRQHEAEVARRLELRRRVAERAAADEARAAAAGLARPAAASAPTGRRGRRPATRWWVLALRPRRRAA